MIETEGLTHLQLTVQDLERSMTFYRSVFGMEEMYRDGPFMVFLRTPGARDTITLNADPNAPGPTPGGIAHFGFRLKDRNRLEEAISAVVDARHPMTDGTSMSVEAKSASYCSPLGRSGLDHRPGRSWPRSRTRRSCASRLGVR